MAKVDKTSGDTVLLIGDLGGTNARFALANPSGKGYDRELILDPEHFATGEEAMAAYLEEMGGLTPDVISLAVAGPVVEGTVRFLNSHWALQEQKLSARFSEVPVRLMNDYTATSMGVPLLTSEDVETVGLAYPWDSERPDYTIAVIGPGTGCGVGGLVVRNGQPYPLLSEGGHMGFAPESRLQVAVLEQLRHRFERVSNERLLSGPGLENIYRALQEIYGSEARKATAAGIFQRAQDQDDEIAMESVQMFFEVLGQAAGNLALALGASDGVFIAGGIVKRYLELLKASGFRSGFENKGRHRSLVERVPTYLITHPQPGLLGAAWMARELGRRPHARVVAA